MYVKIHLFSTQQRKVNICSNFLSISLLETFLFFTFPQLIPFVTFYCPPHLDFEIFILYKMKTFNWRQPSWWAHLKNYSQKSSFYWKEKRWFCLNWLRTVKLSLSSIKFNFKITLHKLRKLLFEVFFSFGTWTDCLSNSFKANPLNCFKSFNAEIFLNHWNKRRWDGEREIIFRVFLIWVFLWNVKFILSWMSVCIVPEERHEIFSQKRKLHWDKFTEKLNEKFMDKLETCESKPKWPL